MLRVASLDSKWKLRRSSDQESGDLHITDHFIICIWSTHKHFLNSTIYCTVTVQFIKLYCFMEFPVSMLYNTDKSFVFVQSLCHVQFFATSYMPGSSVLHYLLEFAQIHVRESTMLFKHCSPLLLLRSILPSIRIFSKELALLIRWPKYWSFSFSINSSNEYSAQSWELYYFNEHNAFKDLDLQYFL